MNEKSSKILVVDDNPKNIQVIGSILKEASEYDIGFAMNGKQALELLLEAGDYDLVLLDVMMPVMNGYETCKAMRQNERLRETPVIFLTAYNEPEQVVAGFEAGAQDYVAKPFNSKELLSRIKTHLELKKSRDALISLNNNLEEIVNERVKEIQQTREVTIDCMASIAEYRDLETGLHIRRTQSYIKLLALRLKDHPKFKSYLTDEVIELIYQSAPLHDIGKVAIPDGILLKPEKLTEEESVIMKRHAILGSQAIAKSEKKLTTNSFLKIAKEIAISHHEKWDGTGYPYGLKGDEIPIAGRLMALADVYDALVTKRVYKSVFTHEKAVQVIMEGRGTNFDPDIVDAFLAVENEFKKTAIAMADNEKN